MTHKTTGHLLAILAIFASAAAIGQNPGSSVPENQELANAQALLQAGREEIIREELRMSDEESADFWPVYEEYIAALGIIRDRKANLIAGFLQAYRDGEFTAEYAEWLITENFEIKGVWLQTQMTFAPRFREVMPAVQVARFFQLENKMDAEVDAQLALVIPLVDAM